MEYKYYTYIVVKE